MNILTDKRCSKCKEWKNRSEFYGDKKRKDGLKPQCKECHNANSRRWNQNHTIERREATRRYAKKNREKIRERVRKWLADHPWKILEYSRRQRANHPETERERSKRKRERYPEKEKARKEKWLANNAERERERRRKWIASHPERNRHDAQVRRARERQAEGKVTINEWLELLDKYGHKCLCCGRTDVKLTMDHVVPLALGGPHKIENIQPLCLSCNSRKRTRIIDYR